MAPLEPSVVSADSKRLERGQRTDGDRPSPLGMTLHQLCGRTALSVDASSRNVSTSSAITLVTVAMISS